MKPVTVEGAFMVSIILFVHTFCKVLKLQEWWYLSVFECLSVTLFTKGGGGLPVQGIHSVRCLNYKSGGI